MTANQLSIIIPSFALHLHAQRYNRRTITTYVRVVEHFGHWLDQEEVVIRLLTPDHIQRFVYGHLPKCHCSRPASKNRFYARAALNRLWQHLRAKKIVVEADGKTSRLKATDRLMIAYDNHMHQVLGLAASTRRLRQHYAQEFLRWRFGQNRPCLQQLRLQDARDFVELRAPQLTHAGTRTLTDALRSLFHYLAFVGHIHQPLAEAVMPPKQSPSPPLTQVLAREQWVRFLKSFNRATPAGLRDYAIALCLGLLGLRAGEVAGLSLEDINWREHTLRLRRTKQQRERLLPLPDQALQALAQYLQRGRPASDSRSLFVSHRPPVGQSLKIYQVRGAIRRAFQRCGIVATGTHILRHTWATWAHRHGVNLKLIADVLGHCSWDTTLRYAHLHLEELRQAALPWPSARL